MHHHRERQTVTIVTPSPRFDTPIPSAPPLADANVVTICHSDTSKAR